MNQKIENNCHAYNKILELAEAKQLDVTTINLAEITGDFIQYIQNLEKEKASPAIISDFIAVAARLLLIKSKTLMPSLELTEEEEEDIEDLSKHIQLFNEFKKASEHIKNLWQEPGLASYSRDYLASYKVIFNPPKNLTAENLLIPLKNILIDLEKLTPKKEEAKIIVVSLEKKINELIERFNSFAHNKFSALVKNRSRGEVVATFLAVLHLLKDNSIKADQEKSFGEIYVKKA